MNDSEFQGLLHLKLKTLFSYVDIKKEWDAAKDSEDDFKRNLYCPRLDIAVGPFNIKRNIAADQNKIDQFIISQKHLIERLFKASLNENLFDVFWENLNHNPRCAIAIEIEKSGTRKHMLGDLLNTAILGKVGIVVPMNESKVGGFLGIQRFLGFAYYVNKIEKHIAQNVIIIRPDILLREIDREISNLNEVQIPHR